MPARLGDAVRIVSTPESERAGLAGLVGTVRGETRPSESGVAVVGGASASDDFALEVRFEARNESHWFPLDLVRFVGSEARAPESGRKATGKWEERDLPRSLWRRLLARLRGET